MSFRFLDLPNELKFTVAESLRPEDRLAFRLVSRQAYDLVSPVSQASEAIKKFVSSHMPRRNLHEMEWKFPDLYTGRSTVCFNPIQIPATEAKEKSILQCIPQHRRMLMSMSNVPTLAAKLRTRIGEKNLAKEVDVMAARWARGRAQVGRDQGIHFDWVEAETFGCMQQQSFERIAIQFWVGDILGGQNWEDAHTESPYTYTHSDPKGLINFSFPLLEEERLNWVNGTATDSFKRDQYHFKNLEEPELIIASSALTFALPYRVSLQAAARTTIGLDVAKDSRTIVDEFVRLANEFFSPGGSLLVPENNVRSHLLHVYSQYAVEVALRFETAKFRNLNKDLQYVLSERQISAICREVNWLQYDEEEAYTQRKGGWSKKSVLALFSDVFAKALLS